MYHLAVKEKNSRSIASLLIAEFGSFQNVICASTTRLCNVLGKEKNIAHGLKLIHLAAINLNKGQISFGSRINSANDLVNYCRASMAFLEVEQFRVFFLNTKRHLILDELQSVGTVDHTSVYPREVLKRVIETGAKSAIFAHNHPSGDTTPSMEDISMTKKLQTVLATIDVDVLDHIIVGRDGYSSLKTLNYI